MRWQDKSVLRKFANQSLHQFAFLKIDATKSITTALDNYLG